MSRSFIGVMVAVLFVSAGLFLLASQRGDEIIWRAPKHATSTSPAASSTTPTKPAPASPIPAKPVTSTSTPVNPEKPLPQAGKNGWKAAIATVFWAGEGATSDNGFIQNASSAWDEDWAEHFGGIDDPDDRCDWKPCGFTPKENPFYIALPYNDLDDEGDKKPDVTSIPWNDASQEKSVIKNRWIEVTANGKSCFGQWEDVGPYFEDDRGYVFGSAMSPKNTYGMKAGIDLSPAMRDCLGVDDVSDVLWRHVEAKNVPAGDWKKVVTTRLSQ